VITRAILASVYSPEPDYRCTSLGRVAVVRITTGQASNKVSVYFVGTVICLPAAGDAEPGRF
jgi:hypothetical protein